MAADAREVATRREGRGAVTSGHRSAHVKAVVLGTILAAAALAYGWTRHAARPVPEPLSVSRAGAPDAEREVDAVKHAGAARPDADQAGSRVPGGARGPGSTS